MLVDGTLQIAEARVSYVGSLALDVCHVTLAGGDDSRIANLYVIELPYSHKGVAATRCVVEAARPSTIFPVHLLD